MFSVVWERHSVDQKFNTTSWLVKLSKYITVVFILDHIIHYVISSGDLPLNDKRNPAETGKTLYFRITRQYVFTPDSMSVFKGIFTEKKSKIPP